MVKRRRSVSRHQTMRHSRSKGLNSAIASRIVELEDSIDNLRSANPRGKLRRPNNDIKAEDDQGEGRNFHSMVEKVANITSRWERTVDLVGLIGNNVKSLSSPLWRNLPLFKSLSSVTGASKNSGSIDLEELMRSAQSLMKNMQGPTGSDGN